MEKVGEKGRSHGKGGAGELIAEEVELHSREDRGSSETGGDETPTVGDPEREEIGVACIYKVREGEYGGFTKRFEGNGGEDRASRVRSRGKEEVGRVGEKEEERQAKNAASERAFGC